jgi:diguanylate cyclase (GGDEF)-like protein/PAS domain S-box-containing protein
MASRDTQPLILAGFGGVLLLTLAVILFGLTHKEKMYARMAEVATRFNTEIDLVLSMRNLVRERSLSLHRMYFTPDPFSREEEFLHFTNMAAEFIELRARLEALGMHEEERAVYDQILARIRRTQPLQAGLAERMIRDDLAGVHDTLVRVDIPLEKEILELFDQLVTLERKEMREALEREQAESDRTTRWVMTLGILSLLLGAGIAAFVMRRARKFEHALYAEKEQAEVTLHSVADGVITTDADGRIRYLNPVAERLTGWPLAEAAGHMLADVYRLADPKTRSAIAHPALSGQIDAALAGLAPDAVLAGRHGADYAVEDSIAPIHNRSGERTGVVLVFRDVTQARAMTRELSWQASHDPLTGLANRREFEILLARLIASAREQGREHVLLYLDLDQFKVVNDTCGHEAGDQLLKQLVALWLPLVRGSDTLARLGGDEFGVLLEACQPERAQQIADRLRTAAQEFRFVWNEKRFRIGVSIGMVVIDADSDGPAEALSMADAACYLAKEHGRNRIWIHRLDDAAVAQRQGEMGWVSRIAKAFDEERFRLYYQRIEPTGAPKPGFAYHELLLRMIDEQGEIIPPMAFLRAAERYDLMGSIDRWVVRQALQVIARFPGNAVFGVNLSSQSLGDDHFLEYVIQQLAMSRVCTGQVCFEITETAAIANWGHAQHFISALREQGCQFALDDFGSGMSSFSYLKNLPVQYIKIDGAFVRDMTSERLDQATVEAIGRVAQVLGVETIAEFVESEETLNALSRLGIDYAQGFAIHRPEPIEMLSAQVERSRSRRPRA